MRYTREQLRVHYDILVDVYNSVYSWFLAADEADDRGSKKSCQDAFAAVRRAKDLAFEAKHGGGLSSTNTLTGTPAFANAAEAWEYFKLSQVQRVIPKVIRLKRDKELLILKTVDKVGTDSRSTYAMSRGPYTVSKTDKGSISLKAAKEALTALRRQISHDRLQSDRPKTTSGEFGNRVGLAYATPGMVLKRQATKRKGAIRLRQIPPQNYSKHIGVELEFCSPESFADIYGKLVNSTLVKNVHLKEDGSLRPSERLHDTHEVTALFKESEYRTKVQELCKILKDGGAYVNRTCGLHVHLDMRSREPEVAYQRLLNALDILYQMTPTHRKYNRFCMRNETDSTIHDHRQERYWAINAMALQRHNTLEIRLHAGSLDANRICNWIALLVRIVNTPNDKRFKDAEQFISALKLPEALAEYVRARVAKCKDAETEEEHVDRVYRKSKDMGRVCTCDDCTEVLKRRIKPQSDTESFDEEEEEVGDEESVDLGF